MKFSLPSSACPSAERAPPIATTPEMHNVVDGNQNDACHSYGAGGLLTHAANQVHGPHASCNGARVLTVQLWQSNDGSFGFGPVA